jgi:hypothetical protein
MNRDRLTTGLTSALLVGIAIFGALDSAARAPSANKSFAIVDSSPAVSDVFGDFDGSGVERSTTSTVNGTTQLVGQLATGSGIGTRTAHVVTASGATGSFSSPFSDRRGRMTGTITGTLFVGTAPDTQPTTLTITVTCRFSYPPLAAACTTVIHGVPIP